VTDLFLTLTPTLAAVGLLVAVGLVAGLKRQRRP
jgi:hypothetical protein